MPTVDQGIINDLVQQDIDADFLRRSMYARLELLNQTGQKLVKEFQLQTAKTLMASGCCLVPSDHLQDNQFCVSRGVYEAAKRLCR